MILKFLFALLSFLPIIIYYQIFDMIFDCPCSVEQILSRNIVVAASSINNTSSTKFSVVDDIESHNVNVLRNLSATTTTTVTQRDRLRGILASLRCFQKLYSRSDRRRRFVVFGGLLLGIFRHGFFMPNDVDADILLMQSDFEEWIAQLSRMKRLEQPKFLLPPQHVEWRRLVAKQLIVHADERCAVLLRETVLDRQRSLVAEVVDVGSGFKTDIWVAFLNSTDSTIVFHEFGKFSSLPIEKVFPSNNVRFIGSDGSIGSGSNSLMINLPNDVEAMLSTEYGTNFILTDNKMLMFSAFLVDNDISIRITLTVAVLLLTIFCILWLYSSHLYNTGCNCTCRTIVVILYIVAYSITALMVMRNSNCVGQTAIGVWCLSSSSIIALFFQRKLLPPTYVIMMTSSSNRTRKIDFNLKKTVERLIVLFGIGISILYLYRMRIWLAMQIDEFNSNGGNNNNNGTAMHFVIGNATPRSINYPQYSPTEWKI